MSDIFSIYGQEVQSKLSVPEINISNIVDEFEFVTSSSYLCEDPTPLQSTVIKTLYGLWPIYPPSVDEQKLLDTLKRNWGLTIGLDSSQIIQFLVLVLGRRSAKSSTLSYLAAIGTYKLICRGNPQKYYHIRDRHPISIMHIASAGKQAASVFTLTSDNIKKVPFFRPYIDFDKDNTTELRMFTPHDLLLNQKIKQRNSLLPRGVMKENTLPGSVNIKSITTSAASSRGDAVFMLLFSEFAHFEWAKFDANDSSETALEANAHTDYAINTALTPSVLDFGTDGKVVYESSPSVKGGEFYHQYCIGGGQEQEVKEDEIIVVEPGYQVIQLATWEARPGFSRETPLISKAYRTNPRGASMEYGSHFGDPSGQFIPESVIKSIPRDGIYIIRKNPGNWKFVLSLDPGGRAKQKKADTYALAWGHYEQKFNDPDIWYFVDGMNGWDEQIKTLANGGSEKILVDPNVVTNYVIELVRELGGRNYVLEIVYDLWNSAAPISSLQSLGMPAVETSFSNPYKSEMYGSFLTEALRGHIGMYGEDEGGWIYRWTQEMKFLQQDIAGNVVYYHHPHTGPVQHDDFADVVANLIYRLTLQATPTKQSMKNAKRSGIAPQQLPKSVRPIKGPSLRGSSSLGAKIYRGR